jgi:hypothetical protein
MLRTAEISIRLFFIFLLFGFLIDLTGWYIFFHQSLIPYLLYGSLFYSVFESLFFLWLTTRHLTYTTRKKIRTIVIGIIVGWFIYTISKGLAVGGEISHSSLFDAFYQILISFLSGFALLQMVEKSENKIIDDSMFWILLGIFFYCFCTFFVFVLKLSIEHSLADQLWPLHNVVNITTYIFYSIGLWQHRTIKES